MFPDRGESGGLRARGDELISCESEIRVQHFLSIAAS